MDDGTVDLKKWIESVEEYQPATWDRLPELELYMDQVLTFMNRQLEPFSPDGERMLTPSMINNYVKDGVLPRPERKKYSRVHLGMLMMICSLKSVLSLPEIAAMLHALTEDGGVSGQYDEFEMIHSKAVKEASSRITESAETDKQALCRLAMHLALEANARRIAAARILNMFIKKDEKGKDKPKKD